MHVSERCIAYIAYKLRSVSSSSHMTYTRPSSSVFMLWSLNTVSYILHATESVKEPSERQRLVYYTVRCDDLILNKYANECANKTEIIAVRKRCI